MPKKQKKKNGVVRFFNGIDSWSVKKTRDYARDLKWIISWTISKQFALLRLVSTN